MLEFCGKLHKELELVYVGQVCLSWEILYWQQRKLQELQQYDAQEFHRYNLVASEFQLFQVLLQRFIEDESFQGPRVQNYVRNRCVLRSFLQVPPIRGTHLNDNFYILSFSFILFYFFTFWLQFEIQSFNFVIKNKYIYVLGNKLR